MNKKSIILPNQRQPCTKLRLSQDYILIPKKGAYMSINLNDIAPDFTVESTEGKINLHDWIGDSYAILFSHPRDFTPVCTTEFAAAARLVPEFTKRNTKIMGISVDSVEEHNKWKHDIETLAGVPACFPIIDDTSLEVSKRYCMLPAEAYLPSNRNEKHTATVRAVFIVGPDKRVRLTMSYPMSVGRNFSEILRALDAILITDGMPIATPANWVPSDDVIVSLSLSDEQAKTRFGELNIRLPYLRYVKVSNI